MAIEVVDILGPNFFIVDNGIDTSNTSNPTDIGPDYLGCDVGGVVPWLPGTVLHCDPTQLTVRDQITNLLWTAPVTFEVNPI